MKVIKIIAIVFLFTSCEVRSSFSIKNNTNDTLNVVTQNMTPKDSLYEIYSYSAIIHPRYSESPIEISVHFDSVTATKVFNIPPNKICVLAHMKEKDIEEANEFVFCKKLVIMSKKDTISATYKNIIKLFTKTKPNNYTTGYSITVNK